MERVLTALKASKEQGTLKMDWISVTENALVKISSRDFHRYRRFEYLERMTIIADSGDIMTVNYPILANRSFIITKDGQLKGQRYGCKNLFEDDDRVIHRYW